MATNLADYFERKKYYEQIFLCFVTNNFVYDTYFTNKTIISKIHILTGNKYLFYLALESPLNPNLLHLYRNTGYLLI